MVAQSDFTFCCGGVEIGDFDNYLTAYGAEKLDADIRKLLEELRAQNIAVVTCTTNTAQEDMDIILARIGFKNIGICERDEPTVSERNVYLWYYKLSWLRYGDVYKYDGNSR